MMRPVESRILAGSGDLSTGRPKGFPGSRFPHGFHQRGEELDGPVRGWEIRVAGHKSKTT